MCFENLPVRSSRKCAGFLIHHWAAGSLREMSVSTCSFEAFRGEPVECGSFLLERLGEYAQVVCANSLISRQMLVNWPVDYSCVTVASIKHECGRAAAIQVKGFVRAQRFEHGCGF